MLILRFVLALATALSLNACQTIDDQNSDLFSMTEDILKNGGRESVAYRTLNIFAYDETENGRRARNIINKYPSFKKNYPSYLRADVFNADTSARMVDLHRIVREASLKDLISQEDEQNILKEIDRLAAEANINNKIDFYYSDDIRLFPSLNAPEAQSIIFRRSVGKLATSNSPDNALIKGVFEKARASGAKSQDAAMVLAVLPSMKLTAEDLRKYVAPVFPEQAKRLLEERAVEVRLIIEPEDRLLYEDVATKLRTISPNLILITSGGAAVTVTVKKLQWEERREPERNQSIVYSQGDVSLLAASLLMPRNASYQYDLTTGGIELAYAFEIKANGKGMPPYDHLLRNKIIRSWRSCSNARIQNVFGGIQRADFVANDHMRRTCNGDLPVSVDRLRDNVLDEVARSIEKIPAIARIAPLH
ncbi:hypothetical protein [Azospirillum argentinense]